MYTAIPDGTRLLDLSIANGTATVDLSAEFNPASAAFDAAARRAGRLHADPVLDGQARASSRSRDSPSAGAWAAATSSSRGCCRRSSSTGPPGAPRAATRCASPGSPTCSRPPSARRSSTPRARSSRTSRSWPPVARAAGAASRPTSPTPSPRRSTGPCGSSSLGQGRHAGQRHGVPGLAHPLTRRWHGAAVSGTRRRPRSTGRRRRPGRCPGRRPRSAAGPAGRRSSTTVRPRVMSPVHSTSTW